MGGGENGMEWMNGESMCIGWEEGREGMGEEMRARDGEAESEKGKGREGKGSSHNGTFYTRIS